MIKRINSTKTIAAPLTPVLLHINIPPFLSFHSILWNFSECVITSD